MQLIRFLFPVRRSSIWCLRCSAVVGRTIDRPSAGALVRRGGLQSNVDAGTCPQRGGSAQEVIYPNRCGRVGPRVEAAKSEARCSYKCSGNEFRTAASASDRGRRRSGVAERESASTGTLTGDCIQTLARRLRPQSSLSRSFHSC
jgi:hypothetical protein